MAQLPASRIAGARPSVSGRPSRAAICSSSPATGLMCTLARSCWVSVTP